MKHVIHYHAPMCRCGATPDPDCVERDAEVRDFKARLHHLREAERTGNGGYLAARVRWVANTKRKNWRKP